MLAAGEPQHQGDKAHDEFLELVIYGNKVPAVANFLHEFYNASSGVIKVCVDPLMTSRAMREVFRYNLRESLKKTLLACRADYWVCRDGEWLNGHGDAFVMANVEVTGAARLYRAASVLTAGLCLACSISRIWLMTSCPAWNRFDNLSLPSPSSISLAEYENTPLYDRK